MKQLKIIESSLSRIWQHITDKDTTFGVVSAYRQDIYTVEENLERHEELRKEIRAIGYGYIEQNSGYSYKDLDTGVSGMREEKSFFIPNIDFDDILYLGNFLINPQESILYKEEIFGMYLCKNGKLDMEFLDEGGIMSFKPKDVEIAYSELIKANQNQKVKFSYIAEKYIPSSTDAFRALKTRKIPEQGWYVIKELFHD